MCIFASKVFNKEQTLNTTTVNVTIRPTRTGSEFNKQTLIQNSRQEQMTQLRLTNLLAIVLLFNSVPFINLVCFDLDYKLNFF